ncbi:tRNA synthetase class I [Thamnocephalis sphaerospora]|uniref:Probable methionine--tRNA ligase, mitochondrial n=1 Tax=Thamnocephalis sphaerospora TaxID=78915 RepID=A0A4P9XY85_9FUNG|nr:tRNA synthetase class I [Thamnocephalis sphaerospora]|eukprot:RKP10661.1 tRNA synthetase class I [Thamnocephalis sphaerospora]
MRAALALRRFFAAPGRSGLRCAPLFTFAKAAPPPPPPPPPVPAHPKPYYVTTPIFYVNADPHIGHFYSLVLADTVRRYQQLRGRDALLATGTDEHGMKIQQAARNVNKTPKELCDDVSQRFRDLATAAGVLGEDTVFTRTTDQLHVQTVHKLWRRLMKSGHIYKGSHEGWYSVSDEAFYQPSQVATVKDPVTQKDIQISTETGQRVEWIVEENYKFRLSAFREPLRRWLTDNPEIIVPQARHNEVLAYLSQEVPDLSISRPRSRLTWGIPVPDDEEHVIYVWLDALTNYLTATRTWERASEAKAWPTDLHVVGKDIIRFHAIYWPAFLMAANLPLPRQILAHAHWTMDKQKMSKSRGNVADPFELLDRYGVDAVRYFMMRDGGIINDSDYSEESIRKRYKKELSGQLGNLLSRATSASLLPNGIFPRPPEAGHLEASDHELRESLSSLAIRVGPHFDRHEFGRGLAQISDAIALANKYFTDNAPWVLARETESVTAHRRLQNILFHSLETVRIAGILLQPVMPKKTDMLLSGLGVDSVERRWQDALLDGDVQGKLATRQVHTNSVLFPKLPMP